MKIEPDMLCVVVSPYDENGVGTIVTTQFKTYAKKVGNVINDDGGAMWKVHPPVRGEGLSKHVFVCESCLRPIPSTKQDEKFEEELCV